MELTTSLDQITGIGPSTIWKLKKLGLESVEDLINHYPFRYDDFSNIKPAIETQIGEVVTLQGEIWSIKNVFTRSKKVLTQAIFNDGTSPIQLTWFNQSWLTKQLIVGDKLQISGKLAKYKNKLSMIAPRWEKISGGHSKTLHTGKLVAVYPETEGLTSKWLRTKISQLLPEILGEINDPLPSHLRGVMLDLKSALQQIHLPASQGESLQGRERLAFDELFYIQLATQFQRQQWQQKTVIKPWQIDADKLTDFLQQLPFKLTKAQQKVINEIVIDLQKQTPMNRLIQGEVGSGKTVVAAAVIYLAHLNGFKTLLMAPTEILAFQHFETLQRFFTSTDIRVGIYTGSKKDLGFESDVIVGTHALLSDKLDIPSVGLIIIDEQQRFGVDQRTKLRNRSSVPHFLTMTATPIPRTVALTLYGDLDLSVIDELPKGRKIVKTHFVPNKKRLDAYKFIAEHIQTGEQIYIITPLIEASETNLSAKAAKSEFERLKTAVFPEFKLGLLHGRLKSKDKQTVLSDFQSGKIQILISTSVVEVGVDIPNATIMVIEGSERFGLAQLHQLRGRVGRSDLQSYCLLFTESQDPGLISRIKHLETTHNGMKLAELDLTIRGSGEMYGIKQSGRWNLKIADITDKQLVERSREAAKKILLESPSLDKYPLLKRKLPSLEVMPD